MAVRAQNRSIIRENEMFISVVGRFWECINLVFIEFSLVFSSLWYSSEISSCFNHPSIEIHFSSLKHCNIFLNSRSRLKLISQWLYKVHRGLMRLILDKCSWYFGLTFRHLMSLVSDIYCVWNNHQYLLVS